MLNLLPSLIEQVSYSNKENSLEFLENVNCQVEVQMQSLMALDFGCQLNQNGPSTTHHPTTVVFPKYLFEITNPILNCIGSFQEGQVMYRTSPDCRKG